MSGQPNGLKIHRDGRIFIADRKNGVMVLDPKGGEPQTVLNGPAPGERFLGLNDLVFSDTGDLYFTDQGRSGLQDPCGRVFRFQPDGTLTKLIDNVPSPNGLVLNARGNALYIAVTRANCVWRMELDDPQHRTGLFVQLPSAGPDGMALDDKGNVAVTHPTYGGVWLFSRTRRTPVWIRSPAGRDDDEHRIWRGRHANAVHHRIAHLVDPDRSADDTRPLDVFASVMQRMNASIALLGDTLLTRRISVFREEPFLRLREILSSADAVFTNFDSNVHAYLDDPHQQRPSAGSYLTTEPALLDELKWLNIKRA